MTSALASLVYFLIWSFVGYIAGWQIRRHSTLEKQNRLADFSYIRWLSVLGIIFLCLVFQGKITELWDISKPLQVLSALWSLCLFFYLVLAGSKIND